MDELLLRATDDAHRDGGASNTCNCWRRPERLQSSAADGYGAAFRRTGMAASSRRKGLE
jgi:hypothetical protein